VRVEVLGPDDWPRWRELRLEALADTPIGFMETRAQAERLADEEWQERMARPGLRLLAYDGRVPLGMAGGFRDPEGLPILFGVYVRPEARGGSVLGALVDAVADWAAPDRLTLDVHVDNVRALRAYEKLGFALTGETTAAGGIDGRDLLRMRR
jgi:RimJ/RimL family protein N-acetyltransferase